MAQFHCEMLAGSTHAEGAAVRGSSREESGPGRREARRCDAAVRSGAAAEGEESLRAGNGRRAAVPGPAAGSVGAVALATRGRRRGQGPAAPPSDRREGSGCAV